MKKFFSLMLVALVMLGVTACEQNVTIDTPKSEGLSFYAEIAMTRASINDEDGDKIWNTTWESNDTLRVTDAENNSFDFVYSTTELNKFTCENPEASILVGKSVTIKLVNEIPVSYNREKGLVICEQVDSFNPNSEEPIVLNPKNSFLRFTNNCYNGADITLTYPENFNCAPFVVDTNNTTSNTFSTSDSGDILVSFLVPEYDEIEYENGVPATLSYSTNGHICKEKVLKIRAGKIYNLGTLTEPVKSDIGVVGSFQGWDVANPVAMYESNDGWIVATNIELYKTDEFKFVKGNTWNESYGGSSAFIAEVNTEYTLTSDNGNNIKVAKNGKFDIYFNPVTLDFKYECVEEYADLTVDITIDNKANWSPLYITLKSGDIVIVDKATVTDNKYTVSGDYIGESLSYTLSNGSKTVEGNVSITKDGATINLEETIIKLTVQLDTDNAKQWWGNTMKIHVWETGTSFDTSWPGNVMTSEGNYTWSIVVPSELVGKTIKYLVHNGNGWQSNDSTVTISAEGNTVTGSSIGIN
ncbi:MAG: hypothetical protein E7126_03600 [Rikenellaceae bacterium]|nr:hypothetical protein [Rikenellaceae bacterium]